MYMYTRTLPECTRAPAVLYFISVRVFFSSPRPYTPLRANDDNKRITCCRLPPVVTAAAINTIQGGLFFSRKRKPYKWHSACRIGPFLRVPSTPIQMVIWFQIWDLWFSPDSWRVSSTVFLLQRRIFAYTTVSCEFRRRNIDHRYRIRSRPATRNMGRATRHARYAAKCTRAYYAKSLS